ncbi:MAG: hypothetical protein ACYC23_12945 [Limisphaerales bacterium]
MKPVDLPPDFAAIVEPPDYHGDAITVTIFSPNSAKVSQTPPNPRNNGPANMGVKT